MSKPSFGTFPVPQNSDYQRDFLEFLTRSGFDVYGHIDNEKLWEFWSDDDFCFENDTFILRPYYWGDRDDIPGLPNFVYKPESLEIRWYKYPFRGAFANKKVSEEEFQDILAECEKSLDSVFGGKARTVYRAETISEFLRKLNINNENSEEKTCEK